MSNDFNEGKDRSKRSRRRRRNYQAKAFLEKSHTGKEFAPRFEELKKRKKKSRHQIMQEALNEVPLEYSE
jgi:hypothetical protein